MRTLILSFMLMLQSIAPSYSEEPSADPTMQVLQERFRIFYGAGGKAVPPAQGALLEQIAALATTLQFLRIKIDGHADHSGTPEANALLARERADGVAAGLSQLGVAPAVLEVEAHGADQPMIARGQSKWNRRVEISVYGIPRL